MFKQLISEDETPPNSPVSHDFVSLLLCVLSGRSKILLVQFVSELGPVDGYVVYLSVVKKKICNKGSRFCNTNNLILSFIYLLHWYLLKGIQNNLQTIKK